MTWIRKANNASEYINVCLVAAHLAAALPEDQFYVSIAPYVDQTHECYYHNLASCQGELVGEDLDVTITSDDGEVLVDETVTTYDNGFVGFWLPRDIEGTIEVEFDGSRVCREGSTAWACATSSADGAVGENAGLRGGGCDCTAGCVGRGDGVGAEEG